MKKLKETLYSANISTGWMYFYVHLITEITCFYCCGKETGDSVSMWLLPFVFDALAFVPQSLVGYLNDKYPKINTGLIGLLLLAVATVTFWAKPFSSVYFSLVIMCLGNAMTHISGAEVTLRSSQGKLSHPAIFVAGGSFGVIAGRLLAKSFVPYWLIILVTLSGIPFTLIADTYKKTDVSAKKLCKNFNYSNKKIPAAIIIALATFIVIVRGYMGYGIPTAWKKTVIQSVILYITMGIGKALGGIFADTFGAKKTAIFSMIAALPFLLLGDNYMMISLIGVMLFSMTMAITLGVLVSVLKETPGLAFGFTTIGLFLGTVPIFFFTFTTTRANCIVISVLTAVCLAATALIMRKDEKTNE